MQSKDGTIWIGTNGGVTAFKPTEESENISPPNIQITKINLFNEHIDWATMNQKKGSSFLLSNGIRINNFHIDGLSKWYNLPEHLSLAYNNNFISFDFIGITMNQPQYVKYQYKLEGLDEKWSTLTTNNSASYGNLPTGSYTFNVKAMSSEGYWTNELKYTFSIQPPWWQTWWFRILSIAAIIMLVFFTFRFFYIYQLRKQRAVLEKQLAVQYERQRISSDLHDDIGSTLSSINIYAGMAKKEPGQFLYLDSISQNVNDVIGKLDDLVWSIKPGHDSLGNIVERLTAFADPAAKTKEIVYTMIIDEVMKEIKPPAEIKHHIYMVTKELINNSLKHADCKQITVMFEYAEKLMLITVKDDGRGFDMGTMRKERNGLQNITQRVNEMNGKLEIESNIGEGSVTRIWIAV
ncbi:MAG: triple tyrosine motif-containing protein [Saprospiraceae bacterium]